MDSDAAPVLPPVFPVAPDGTAAVSPHPAGGPAFAGVPTGGWTVPSAPSAPRVRGPVQGKKVMIGGGVALGGHVFALVVASVIAFTGSVYDSGWLVIVAMEVLLFFGCLTFGVVWFTSRDRGIGIGLLIGWPLGLLVPLVVVGFYVLGMVAPIGAVFEAEM